ncbi:MAG: c-type cytochrome [Planctomycetaceae bacterium]|nr:c-type cytochrome [Planctomycetaceae bacterium]
MVLVCRGLSALVAWLGLVVVGGAAEFPIPANTEKATDAPLAAAEVVRTAKLPPGFTLSVFAAEPDVHNPIAMTTDERGRLWVAENYSWAGNGDGGFRPELRDRVVIFDDTDGDGRHDRRTVFWDDARRLTSIEVGRGGLWAICLPNLLFIPDADRDDRPDAAPQVVLDGFDGGAGSHTPANGLKWGPDGWLYGRQGIQVTSFIGKPGQSESQRLKFNTGVWRYHPGRGAVEPVMHGMTNSWGFDFDKHGELFVINTVIGHLWHCVAGVHTERMYGADPNPHVFQLVKQTADHVHWDTGEVWNDVRKGVTDKTSAAGGGHAHIGLMIYQGDNWPAEYRDRVYTLNLHGRRLNADVLRRDGAGYTASHGSDFCFIADPWYRGMELLTGPDGGVLIADWSDTGECHDHDGVHRTSGRIYKLVYGKPKRIAPFDLGKSSDRELLALLGHENQWWCRQARRLLTERATAKRLEENTAAALRDELKKQADVVRRLRLLETLVTIGAADEELLTASLGAESEFERAAAVRFLVDLTTASTTSDWKAARAKLVDAAASEKSGLVLLHLASALPKLPADEAWRLARRLCERGEFAGDRMYPHLVWYGLEPLVAREPARGVELALASRLPLIAENVTRRLALDLAAHGRWVDQLVAAAASSGGSRGDSIVAGLAHALHGLRRAEKPASWPSAAEVLAKSANEATRGHVRSLNVVFGEGRAVEELKQLVVDASADAQSRRQALAALLEGRPENYAATLWQMLTDRALTLEALRGLAYYDDPNTPAKILNRLRAYDAAERAEAINTLSVRPAYALALLTAIREGKIAASEVSAFHARQMRDFDDPRVNELLKELWGEVRVSAGEKRALIGKFKGELTAANLATADLSAGRAVFQKTCANCHVLYGAGRKIGPDLTGSNRKNIDYLLENIVDPSASVAADFRSVSVTLDDGRVLSGVVGEQNERTLTLLTAQEPQTIDRREIEELAPTGQSLMPDGLLQNLTPRQIRDLVGYLMSIEQVPLPQ